MDDATRERMQALQDQITVLSMFTGQALALLAMDHVERRNGLDQIIAKWEKVVDRPAGTQVMNLVRDSADKMLAAGRRSFPESGAGPVRNGRL